MAFNLFKKKEDDTTPFYSIESLSEEQKNNIRQMYAEIESGTSTLDEQSQQTVSELKNRLDAPKDRFQELMGMSYADRPRDFKTDRSIMQGATGRRLKKTDYLYSTLPESQNTFTNVESVLKQKEEKQEIEEAVRKIDEDKRREYIGAFGYDVYEDNGNQAWKKWIEAVRDDPTILEKVLEKSPKIREEARANPGIEESLLRRKWQNSLEKGTLQEDFFDIDVKELQRAQKERQKPIYGAFDAFADIKKNWEQYIPGGGFIEAKKLIDITELSKRFTDDPSSLSDSEFNELKNWVEYQDFKSTANWEAQLVGMLAQMPSFMVEVGFSGGAVSVASKAGSKAMMKVVKKHLNRGLKRKINRELKNRTALKVAKGATSKVAIATVGTNISGDVESNKIRNMMPGYEFVDGKLEKIYHGMDKFDAERQAYWGTFIEFGSEMVGGVPGKLKKWIGKTKVGKYTSEKFFKGWKKLGLPEKEYLMNSAVVKAFKNANPGASDKDVTKIF